MSSDSDSDSILYFADNGSLVIVVRSYSIIHNTIDSLTTKTMKNIRNALYSIADTISYHDDIEEIESWLKTYSYVHDFLILTESVYNSDTDYDGEYDTE